MDRGKAQDVDPSSSIFSISPNDDGRRGMKLLLLSAAGYSTAIGFTVGRWLLMETGEVILLLLHDDHRRDIGKENDHPNFDSMNVLENYSCVDEQHQQQHQQLREVEPN